MILEAWRGKGLSKVLLSAVLERLSHLGHSEAYLLVAAGNFAAINLYLANSFRPLLEDADEELQWAAILETIQQAPRAPASLPPANPAAPIATYACQECSHSSPLVVVESKAWREAVNLRVEALSLDPSSFLADASKDFAVCGLAAVVYSAAVILPRKAFFDLSQSLLFESMHVPLACLKRFQAKWSMRHGDSQLPDLNLPAAIDHALCWALAEYLRSHHLDLFSLQMVHPEQLCVSWCIQHNCVFRIE